MPRLSTQLSFWETLQHLESAELRGTLASHLPLLLLLAPSLGVGNHGGGCLGCFQEGGGSPDLLEPLIFLWVCADP